MVKSGWLAWERLTKAFWQKGQKDSHASINDWSLSWKQTVCMCVCRADKPSQMLVSVGIGGVHRAILPELCLCPNVNPEAGRSSISVWFHSDTAQLTHESLVTLGERPHAWLTAKEVAKTHVFSPNAVLFISCPAKSLPLSMDLLVWRSKDV